MGMSLRSPIIVAYFINVEFHKQLSIIGRVNAMICLVVLAISQRKVKRTVLFANFKNCQQQTMTIQLQ